MLITNADIYTPAVIIQGGVLRIEGERIVSVEPAESRITGEPIIDGRGLLLIPGLIDMQCNGFGGHDVRDGAREAIANLAGVLARFGCTAVLPTIVSSPPDVLRACLAAIAEAVSSRPPGASILGAHQEGPWLNPRYHGAHLEANIRPFEAAEWEEIQSASRGTVRMVTLAPEVPGNEGAVGAIVAAGAIASLGHSGADYAQAAAAAVIGARMATHLFNAMVPFLHRAPGLPGAALDHEDLIPGIIPDGHHIHPAAIRLAVHAKGLHGVVVVTDSVSVAGCPPGEYTMLGQPVTWDGETVRRRDGGLAGSGLSPIEALRRYIRFAGLSLHEALPAMTSTPARLLGLQDERGSIAPGARADVVLLTPDHHVHTTIVGGQVVYRA
ncbi:MAG TPA: N-acetylglucosamine-6-phosphate deacetylase [Chloroflexota bacterium]|nr:N-acetylglucosamine-6-phosphate deacetylase [Chloroflexota bacterium]